jgi:protoheme IX farnesyltransferase
MNTAAEIIPAPVADLAAETPISKPRSRSADILELIRPRMNLLVLGTTMVGCCMAANSPHDWLRLPPTLIGTAFCAAAASILNQVVERRYDALMPRTAHRPLPTGRVSPRFAAILGISCGIIGGLCLLLFVNRLTALLGIGTMGSYVALYTPMKRRTTLNTVIGAIPGAIPPVMGWTAIAGSISLPALALFAILFVWQIPHFLAIAILYREDYRKGGFKMLPVSDTYLMMTGRQIILNTAALIPITLVPTIIHLAGTIYFTSAFLLGVAFLAFAIHCATARTRLSARKLFFASIIYLPVLLTMLMLDRT